MKVIDVRAFVLPTRRAVMAIQARQHQGRCVHANGIDIHYVEAGQGEPLLLLDNAMVSTNPIWASVPFAYASFMATLAEHWRQGSVLHRRGRDGRLPRATGRRARSAAGTIGSNIP